jgi:hypothetical protein
LAPKLSTVPEQFVRRHPQLIGPGFVGEDWATPVQLVQVQAQDSVTGDGDQADQAPVGPHRARWQVSGPGSLP